MENGPWQSTWMDLFGCRLLSLVFFCMDKNCIAQTSLPLCLRTGQLCKLWDARGLLRCYRGPILPGHFSRLFNAYKSADLDRQIGDRRLPNARERSIDGPSTFLPWFSVVQFAGEEIQRAVDC
jgi:hypothetical protein